MSGITKDKLIGIFNGIISNLVNDINDNIPNDIMLTALGKTIIGIVRNDKYYLITKFLKNIYENDEIRENIILENDAFFLKEFDVPDGKDDYLIMLRSCWGELSEDMKKYVKRSMKTLIECATKYIEYL